MPNKALAVILIIGASALINVHASVDCSECGPGEFLVSSCDLDTGKDRECGPCSSRCGEGITDCIADGLGDALCKECNFDTDVDMFLSLRTSLDVEGYGYCKFCSTCREDLGLYLSKLCHGTHDNHCEACTECSEDEVEVSPCTATSNRKCEPKGSFKPDQEYYVSWAEMQACVTDPEIKDLSHLRSYLSTEYSPKGGDGTLWDLIHRRGRQSLTAPRDVSEIVEDIYWPAHREQIPAVSEKCAEGAPKGCCCKAMATWRFEARVEEKEDAAGLIRDLKGVKSADGFCVGLSGAGILKEQVNEMGELVRSNAEPGGGKASAGKVVGFLFLAVVLVAVAVGGVCAWRKRDKLEKYLPESWKKAERLGDQAGDLPESTTPTKDVGPPFGSDIAAFEQSEPMDTDDAGEGQFKSLDIDGGSAIDVAVVARDVHPDEH